MMHRREEPWFKIFLMSCIAFRMVHNFLQVPIGVLFRDESEDNLLSILTYAAMRNNYDHRMGKMLRIETKKGIMRKDSINDWAVIKLACELMKDGIFAIGSSANIEDRRAFQALSDILHIPFLNWAASLPVDSHGRYELWMSPQVVDITTDFLVMRNWTEMLYLYDSFDGLHQFKLLQDHVESRGLKLKSWLLFIQDMKPDYFRFFLNLHAANFEKRTHVILHIRSRLKLKMILRDLLDAAMKTRNFHYLVIGQEVPEADVEKFKMGMMNFSAFQFVDRNSATFKEVVKNWNQFEQKLLHRHTSKSITLEEALVYDSVLLLIKAFGYIAEGNATLLSRHFHKDEFWNDDYRGLLCYPKEDKLNPQRPFVTLRPGPLIYETMKRITLEGLTGRIEFNSAGQRINGTVRLMELEFTGHLSQNVEIQTYDWKHHTGFKKKEAVERKREVLDPVDLPFNRTRIITTIFNEPFFMLKKDADNFKGNDKYEGFCVDLMKLLSEKMGNFPYLIQPVKDNEYGTVDLNGRWNGMVGELIRGEADLAIASLTINTLRERVVDFSKPFLSTGISIMLKKPDKQEFSIFSFMQPLSAEVWLFITIACCAVSVVLYLISRFSPYEWFGRRNSAYGLSSLSDFTFDNCLWVSFAALMQQGTDIIPRSVSCRIASSIWWFFTLIIVSSYTANLAAFLTLERMYAPIESVEDLAKQSKIRYGIQASGSTAEFFKESRVDVYRRMWQYMASQTPSVFVKDYAEGIQRVRDSKGEFAFLLEATANEYAGTRKPCNTMKVGMNLNSIGYGVATPFNSDLGEKINLAILELQEIGELKRLEMKWWYEKGQCDQGISDSQSASLTLSKVAGIFYILIGGMVLAMIFSLIEFWHYVRKERKFEEKENSPIVTENVNCMQSPNDFKK